MHAHNKLYTWFNLLRHHVITKSLYTRRSAIAERPRCRVRYSFRQKWTGRQYFTDIIGLSSTTVIQSAWQSVEFCEKTQNKGYYGVQGHWRSSRSVPIESPYANATFYWWLIVTDILSRTVPELSQLIVQISHQGGHFDSNFQEEGIAPPIIFARIVRPMNALQLCPWQFSHSCYGWGATSENRSKISDFAPTRSHFDPKFQVQGVTPHQ